MVWKLLKCLYGLKQSPRMWNQTNNKVLEEIGFVHFKTDHGVYVFGVGDARVFSYSKVSCSLNSDFYRISEKL